MKKKFYQDRDNFIFELSLEVILILGISDFVLNWKRLYLKHRSLKEGASWEKTVFASFVI